MKQMKEEKVNIGNWKDRRITYEVVLVKVTNRLGGTRPWAKPFIGDERQAVKVMVKGHMPFYLDNEDGTGLNFVTKANSQVETRSLGEPIVVKVLPKEEWNKKVLKSVTKTIEKESAAYWAKK